MLGALVASGLFALVGTALRGLLRPVSWSLFAIAALFAASNQSTSQPQSTVPGSTLVSSPTETLSLSQAEPSQIPTLTPSSSLEPLPIPQAGTESNPATETAPEAVRGWQSLPEQLEPTVTKVLGGESIQPKSPVTIISDTPPSPIAQASPTDRAPEPIATPTPAPRSPAPTPTPTPSAPIKGFW